MPRNYVNDFYLKLVNKEIDDLLQEFQVQVKYNNYCRISYNIWTALKAANIIEIYIDDQGWLSPGKLSIYADCEKIYISDTEDKSFSSFIADFYNWSPAECGYEIKNIPKVKKEKENTMKMFNGLEFGTCEKDNIKLSPYGIAVKNANGVYVSYNKETGDIVDVDIANFNGGKYLFKMPVAFKDIAAGDVIIHNRKPHFVTEVKGGNITAVDVCEAEEKRVIPVSNMFGFNFVTKVVSLFDTFMAPPSADQPFGNMLPFMLMNDSADADSEGLALAMMLSQGGGTANMNPMMWYFLLGDNKNNNILPLMLMMNQPGVALTPTK